MKEIREQDVRPFVMEQIPKGAFLTVQAGNEKNVMTIGWALFGFVWRSSTMMVAVRNSRFTYGLMEKAEAFSVSVPTGSMEKEIELCGTKSGRKFDKLKECGWTLVPGAKARTPILDVPGYHFECRTLYKTPMDPNFFAGDIDFFYPKKDYHTLYFGEILGCYQRD